MMTTDPSADEAAHTLRELQAAQRAHVLAQLELIRDRHPAIVADAERFVLGTNFGMPWELRFAFDKDEYAALATRYEVPTIRHKPDPSSVPPRTALFCEASQLIYRRQFPDAQHLP